VTSAFSLAGRRALVTGASKGIGAACARALDAAGARVALLARSADALAEVAATMRHDPVVLVADLAAAGAPNEVAERALRELGGLDVLVNNAAVAARLDSLELEGATVDELYHLNVRQLLLLTTALLPALVESGHGSVVNLSSVSGVVGTPRRAAYAATKGAVDALTRSLAMEFGPRGVRLNSVAPGCIVTDLWERNRAVPGVIEGIEAQIALRRWGQPEDVADVVAFLASDAARYITGVTVPVDGGMATTLDIYGGAV
jgi:NAD(P)-dependent dehydrogenase (short-subunit alcohol dehydrogenase family)